MTIITRETTETQMRVELSRGTGAANVDTGARFLDHMLVTFARYSRLDLHIRARGDLKHHLIEDVAICVGTALADIVQPGAARYGDRTVPMDDALVQCTLDVGARPFYQGPLPSSLYDHWMRSFADNARTTLHLRVLRGTDRHHVVEAAFKALGFALRDALTDGGANGAVLSTKGAVQLRGDEAGTTAASKAPGRRPQPT